MAKSNYDLLINKLDGFIRKYYKNQLLRGLLFFAGSLVALYLIISVVEYYAYLPKGGRKFLFFGFVGIAVVGLVHWIISPALKLQKLGKVISHHQAATIIGTHFTEIQDKLLNILQLKEKAAGAGDLTLIEASINQKSEEIKPIPFNNAIDLTTNKKYLKYALPPVLALVVLLFAAPNILRDSNERLLNNNKEYVRQAPFQFSVLNDELEVLQYDDYNLEVKVTGEQLPQEVFAQTGEYRYRLEKTGPNTFKTTFNKVPSTLDFKLEGSGFSSKNYTLNVIPKPILVNFETTLDYPSYTKRKDQRIANTGDLTVPEGTNINWVFNTEHTAAIKMTFAGESSTQLERTGSQQFSHSKKPKQAGRYQIEVKNDEVGAADSIAYTLNIIPDEFPELGIERVEDSTNLKYLFFSGLATDDYGLSRLEFHIKHEKEDEANAGYQQIPVAAPLNSNRTQFTFNYDLNELDINPGDIINYYFVVWDNDGINGAKSSKSQVMAFKMPTLKEFKEENKKDNEKIKKDLKEGVKEAAKLQKEIKQAQDKLLEKKELTWEDKKAVEKVVEKQKNLQELVQELQKQFKENTEKQSDFKQVDERITEKQERLQEMFDELLTPEMKELFQKMEEMMEELNKDEALEQLEEFDISNEQLEKELDRMMELFKQLEFEQKMQETVDELQKLANEQKKLANKTELKKESAEALKKEQDKLNEEFEEVQKDLEDLKKMNEELEKPNELDEMKEEQKDAKDKMEESSDQLEKKQEQKASESQKQAGEKMQEMADKMAAAMAGMAQEQLQEDMNALRQLLENLVQLSFDQEEVLNELKDVQLNTPKYVDLIKEQQRLKTDSKMVEDSLTALSKRQAQISSYVNREMALVNNHMEKSLEQLAARNKQRSRADQQYVMTGYNNLALMLDEVMQQMQQQMSSMMPGSQMCQNPGGGKPSMGGLSKMQQQMQQQLEDMMSKKGQKPGGEKGQKEGQKPGEQGQGGKGSQAGKGDGPSSKEYAEMARQQAAMRKALEEFNKSNGKDGKNPFGNELGEMAKDMEHIEEQLLNKQLTNEMLQRQKDISVRMLEAENAQKQREKSPERKGKQANEIAREVPPAIEEYLKQRQSEIEQYKTVPPNLKPYFKSLVEHYYNSVGGLN